MTRKEWLQIGISNGIITNDDYVERSFFSVYQEWFLFKGLSIRSQSLDRIECVYNRYYRDTAFVDLNVSLINENVIIDFIRDLSFSLGPFSVRDFGRFFQIVNNVMTFAKDRNLGGAVLLDWEMVKNYSVAYVSDSSSGKEYAVSPCSVSALISGSLVPVYPYKYNACLALCMNFYLGLRIGELAGLCFSDFDFTSNVVRVNRTQIKYFERDKDGKRDSKMSYAIVPVLKTENAYREIPLLDEVKLFYDLIAKRHKAMGYDSPYLCYDGMETIMVRSLDRTLRRLCTLCGIRLFNSHLIRKTFATKLHYAGVPTKLIGSLMGHADIATTERNYILNYKDTVNEVKDMMVKALNYSIEKDTATRVRK